MQYGKQKLTHDARILNFKIGIKTENHTRPSTGTLTGAVWTKTKYRV